MKLETLKSSKFGAMTDNQMSVIKGGDMSSTNSRDVKTGEAIHDRQEITLVKDSHGNYTGGVIYGCTEYFINGVWYSPSVAVK